MRLQSRANALTCAHQHLHHQPKPKATLPHHLRTHTPLHQRNPPTPWPRSYGWKWDSGYQEAKYTFSNLDKTTIANVSSRSARLWAHAIITWLVTFVCYRWLWK